MAVLKNGNRTLYYETAGSGRPLVLLHGFTADSANWLSVKEALAARYTLIIPDNRFSGRSTAPDEPATAAELACDTAALLDALGVEKAVIAGHSMGGYVAQEFALAFPARAEKLVLEATAACTSARNRDLFRSFHALLLAHGYDDVFWHTLYAWILSPGLYERPRDIEALIKFAREYPHLSTPRQIARQIELMTGFDSRGRLAGVKAPTLVISGGQDILIPASEGRALAAAIPGARFTLADASAHVPHFEQAEFFAATVAGFIDRD